MLTSGCEASSLFGSCRSLAEFLGGENETDLKRMGCGDEHMKHLFFEEGNVLNCNQDI